MSITNIEVNHALTVSMWLVLKGREEEAWNEGDISLALYLGEIMGEIRTEARGMLQDETHPGWELDRGRDS